MATCNASFTKKSVDRGYTATAQGLASPNQPLASDHICNVQSKRRSFSSVYGKIIWLPLHSQDLQPDQLRVKLTALRPHNAAQFAFLCAADSSLPPSKPSDVKSTLSTRLVSNSTSHLAARIPRELSASDTEDASNTEQRRLLGDRSHAHYSGRRALLSLAVGSGLVAFEFAQEAVAAGLERDSSASQGGAVNTSKETRRANVFELKGGVKALDVRRGTGAIPQEGDTIAIHYYGRLGAKQGWRFDSSYEHKDLFGVPEPFVFTLGSGQVIAGIDTAVRSMHVGGIRRVVIPPDQGYQNKEQGPIPPDFFDRQRLYTTIFNPTRLANGEGATLGTVIFDIELVRIQSLT